MVENRGEWERLNFHQLPILLQNLLRAPAAAHALSVVENILAALSSTKKIFQYSFLMAGQSGQALELY